MFSSLFAILSLIGMPSGAAERPSFLFKMQTGPAKEIQLHGERYEAQPGDIVLFNDHNAFTTKVYQYCGTGAPLHAGVVFRKTDGTTAILEAGTNAVMKVFVFDLDPRLHDFDGTILVRRLREPLTANQAEKLRDFALRQEGKPYAVGRLLLQATPFRPRSSVLAEHFGRTVLDRQRWICSELVIAAMASADAWSVDTFPANLMYPRDLCYDERFDLSPYYETPALWSPRAELEYVGKGVRVGLSK